jgi:hypothetical protein
VGLLDLVQIMMNLPKSNEDVKFFGKVPKLPKGIKASKGYNFLENVKVSKSSN